MSTILEQFLGPFSLDYFHLPKDPQVGQTTLFWYAFFTLFWFVLFFLIAPRHPLPAFIAKRLKTKEDRFHVGHRLVCMYAGAATFIFPLYWVLFSADYTCGRFNSPFEIVIFSSLAGHYISDTLFMYYHGFLDFGNLLHHFMGILAYSQGLYFQHNFYQLMPHLVVGEITNVNMHLREVYRRMGWRYTWTYYFNEYQYSYMYMLARGVLIPACFYL